MADRTSRAILLLGSAGSGKGTQARLLSRIGMHHLDFGNTRRTAVENQTPAGRRIAALGDLVSRGKFLDDDLVTDIFLEALHAKQREGMISVVLDGFPRNCEQLRRLREEIPLDLAVVLHAPFETLLRRIDGRLIHKPSGRTYHPTENPPAVPMRDDVTGEPLEPRFLSTNMGPEEALRSRCSIEAKEVGPMIEQLKQEGLVEHVQAEGLPEEVHANLLQVLASKGLESLTPPFEPATGRPVLPQTAIETYHQRGWIAIEGVLHPERVSELRAAVDEVIASSASSVGSTAAFDLDQHHSPSSPRVRKIKRPHMWHPSFAAVVSDPLVLDIVEALLKGGEGASRGVRFQGDKVVVKAPEVGQHVVCHQDWAFYPHTNDSLCTVSVVLEDMTLERGGLCFVPSSHRGDVFSHHNSKGEFSAGIVDSAFDCGALAWDAVNCPAGSIVVHHARAVHASPANSSGTLRRLLLLQYAANDAWPLQQHSRGAWGVDLPAGHRVDEWALHCRSILRGTPCPRPRLVPVPVSIPAPWPARGSLGSLYQQLASVQLESVLDPAATDLTVVGPSVNLGAREPQQTRYQWAPGPPPSSGVQVATLWHRAAAGDVSDAVEWQRLLHFVGAGPYGSLYRFPDSRRRLQAALVRAVQAKECEDDDVYDALHACFHQEIVGSEQHQQAMSWSADRTELRAAEVVAKFRECCPADPSSCSVLDVGCADGAIVAEVGALLGVPPTRVHGCDSREAMLAGAEATHGGMTFSRLPPQGPDLRWSNDAARVLPYTDDSFDLVFSLMTLHHVRRLKQLLDEVFRVLKPGGVFIFRDHDCHSPQNASVIDIMHGLHHRTWAVHGHPNYRGRGWLQAHFSAHYHTAFAWNLLATAAGLSPHSSMGESLQPAGGDEVVKRIDDADGAALGAEEVRAVLGAGARERQLLHFGNPKRVVFGVYVK